MLDPVALSTPACLRSWATVGVVEGGHALHSSGLRNMQGVWAGGGTGVPWVDYKEAAAGF